MENTQASFDYIKRQTVEIEMKFWYYRGYRVQECHISSHLGNVGLPENNLL